MGIAGALALAGLPLLLAACGTGRGEGEQTRQPALEPAQSPEITTLPTLSPLNDQTAAPPAGLTDSLLAHLAGETGRSAGEFVLVSLERRTWPDGCLGLGKPGGVCSQAFVPGWLVIFRDTDGTEYRYRAGPGHFALEE